MKTHPSLQARWLLFHTPHPHLCTIGLHLIFGQRHHKDPTMNTQPSRLLSLPKHHYSTVAVQPLHATTLLAYNEALAAELGLPAAAALSEDERLSLAGDCHRLQRPPIRRVGRAIGRRSRHVIG